MKFLASGKVKDIYEWDDTHLLFRFSDRVSAYDVKLREGIPRKGEVLCKFAEFWFEKLDVKSHFLRRESGTELIVRKMDMLPVECIVRGYFYGSLADRARRGEAVLPENANTEIAAKLPEPYFDPTTKSEHDTSVTHEDILDMGVTEQEYDTMQSESIRIYEQMLQIAENAGFILADLKLEFGRLDGGIVLGDSIGPDEYRLWPAQSYKAGRIQEAYDKQILRDWLTSAGYKKQFEDDRAQGKIPVPPDIPDNIIQKMSARYVESYERITGYKM